MPSPIAHVAVGYAIYKAAATCNPHLAKAKIGPVPKLLVTTVALSHLPDLDFVPGFFVNEFARFHNNFSHSLFAGVIVALVIGSIGGLKKNRAGFIFWFTLALVSYQLHVIMDTFTYGRGVMLLWPFSTERYPSPVLFFYGLRRSDGLISVHHIWTLLTEMLFALFIIFLARVILYKPQRLQKIDSKA